MNRLTPRALLGLCRLAVVAGGLGMTVLMLGPFQGAEQAFGLNDKAAHAIAFYAATMGLFLAAPRTRRTDLALAAIAFGLVMELVQGMVGRSMSVTDFAADIAGATAAVAPGLIERLRHHVRAHPNLSFAQIAANDRRRRRKHRTAVTQRTAEPQGQAASA